MRQRNKSLPVPLHEFNKLVESNIKYARLTTGKTITLAEARREAEQLIKANGYPGVEAKTEVRRVSIVESWQGLGLSKDAARIAARVEESMKPKEMTTEDWANLKW